MTALPLKRPRADTAGWNAALDQLRDRVTIDTAFAADDVRKLLAIAHDADVFGRVIIHKSEAAELRAIALKLLRERTPTVKLCPEHRLVMTEYEGRPGVVCCPWCGAEAPAS